MFGFEYRLILSMFYITVCFTPTKEGFEQYCVEPVVDKGFWEPHLNTDYDSEEI